MIAASDSNRIMTGPEETRFPLSGLCDGIASGAFSRGLVLKQSGHVCTVRQRSFKRYQQHSLSHYATPSPQIDLLRFSEATEDTSCTALAAYTW